ncbi:tRNA (adenosine(37)-N6)-threonylcarbamoyltransferase complex dimerization subunit type 1 TsaB [Candidatus Peregrinibacteria bacterium]|nr:tRNA (adenosine(37)-N6)-threonylcarbamoyltransferase complex dimerization subunit type 1 TsaB [Candidatus Peregrinibacteria bacterium]
MLLGLNTATNRTYNAFIDNNKVVDERSWPAVQNEAETLLPRLQSMLDRNGMSWETIDEIAVVSGPGPFTALRVSIAIANALAYGLQIPLIDVPTIDFWEFRSKNYALYAGRNMIFYQGKLHKDDAFFSLLKPGMNIAGQLRTKDRDAIVSSGCRYIEEEALPGLGAFLVAKRADYKHVSLVKPRYFNKPHITVSSKAYK